MNRPVMRHARARNGKRGPIQGLLSLCLVFSLPLVVMTCVFVLASYVLQWIGVIP